MEIVALLIGFGLVALLGTFHHFGLRGLDLLSGPDERKPNRTMVTISIGLLVLHTLEIVVFAAASGRFSAGVGWVHSAGNLTEAGAD